MFPLIFPERDSCRTARKRPAIGFDTRFGDIYSQGAFQTTIWTMALCLSAGERQIQGCLPMSMPYRPSIDGLRAVAVLAVMLFHAEVPGFAGGFVGVDVFFVISGYLITSIILKQQATGSFSLLGFYERRARRILPALFLVMAVTIIAAGLIVPPYRFTEISESAAAALTFTANVYFWATSDYFATASRIQPLIHTWSLGVEEQFYIVFPLLMIALASVKRFGLGVIFAVLAIFSLGVSEFMARNYPDAAFYLPQARAYELLAGVLVALYRPAVTSLAPLASTAMRICGGLMIMISVFTYHDRMYLPGIAMLLPVAGTALMLFADDRDEIAGKALAWRPLVMIGLFSYSLYLWHQPILALARLATLDSLDLKDNLFILLACFPLSWATWHFIEQPFRNARRVSLRPFLLTGGTVAVAILANAAVMVQTRGLEFMTRPEYVDIRKLRDSEGLKRVAGIRTNECHYRAGAGSLDDFRNQWNCLGNGRGASVIVLGDSHAADKAFALRVAGIEPAQMTGAGCAVVPRLMSEECASLFRLAMEQLEDRTGLRILLSQSVTHTPLTAEDIAAAMEFFKPFGKPVVWASPMPVFPNIEDEMARRALAGEDPFAATYSFDDGAAQAARAAMIGVAGPANVFDTQKAFCEADGGASCAAHIGRQLLLVDPDHVSSVGALAIGRPLSSFLFGEERPAMETADETVPIGAAAP